MSHCCSIVPMDVLRRLSRDKNLSAQTRSRLAQNASVDLQLRRLRTQAGKLTAATMELAPALSLIAAPTVTVYDCRNSMTTPGLPVTALDDPANISAKQVFDNTTAVAGFYSTVFGRNSIDNAGMTMLSSVHYGKNYPNALWIGSQMIYGDGDGDIFLNLCNEDDVVCHEITHGLTQHTLQLSYTGEAGGINEGNSDVFGSMFRQWKAGQTVDQADWLIGAEVLGPTARQKYTCIRDLSQPDAPHCVAAQRTAYAQITPAMDPHYSSGVPNFAFYKMAMAIGGNSWEAAGQIWYNTLVGLPPSPNLLMKDFANFMRQTAARLFPANAAIIQAVDQAWAAVGLPA